MRCATAVSVNTLVLGEVTHGGESSSLLGSSHSGQRAPSADFTPLSTTCPAPLTRPYPPELTAPAFSMHLALRAGESFVFLCRKRAKVQRAHTRCSSW